MKTYDQNQHFVPKGYLRGFTMNNAGFFYRRNKGTALDNYREVHVNNVCYIKNFYDIEGADLRKRYGIDRRFLEIEFNRYENHLRKLLDGFRYKNHYIYKESLDVIINAYTSMKHRTPFSRRKIEQMMKDRGHISRTVDNSVKNELIPSLISMGIPIDKLDFNDIVNRTIERTLNAEDAGKNAHLSGMVSWAKGHNQALENARRKLFGMDLTVLIAKEGHFFFTSDNPGFTTKELKTYNTNFSDFDGVVFPISSKQVLKFENYNGLNYLSALRPIRYKLASVDDIQNINNNTFFFADESVFCEDKAYLMKFAPELWAMKKS